MPGIYSQKLAKCGEESYGAGNRISYHLLLRRFVHRLEILMILL
jgi:hypothetical protein